jgi:hypothetical protein
MHATFATAAALTLTGSGSGSVEIRNFLGARRRRTKSRSDAVACTIPPRSSTKTPTQIECQRPFATGTHVAARRYATSRVRLVSAVARRLPRFDETRSEFGEPERQMV